MSNLFDNLSPDEKKLLDTYENTITSGELTRTDDEKIFDKLSLLAKARLATNSSRRGFKIDTDYIEDQIESLKKIPPNYSEEGELSATARMITNLYEAKKSANYNITSDGMLTSENRRTTNFTAAGKDFSNFLQTNDNNGSLDIINQPDSGWIYRKPKNFPKGPVDHRYALNVKQNKELLHKLDEFAAKHKMHYKTGRELNWHDRTDAIVIYCSTPQTAEEIAELKKIAAPYIRRDKPSRTNDLDGEIIADGIATAKETTPRQCAELYHKLKAVNPTIANTFRKMVDEQIQKNPHNPISLGQFQNYTNLLDTFTAERNKAPQQNDRQQPQTATDKSLSHLRGQDYVFAMLDQLYAQNKAKLAQQKDSSVKHNGPSARQKAQEHMGGHTNNIGKDQNQQRMPVEKNNWKTKLKKAAVASLRLTQKLIKEALLAPYHMANDINNKIINLGQMPTKQKPNPKYDWRNNPQRMAQVSLRYNRMLNQQKTKPQQRKDLAQFIQSMRNGNNTALQPKTLTTPTKTTENQPSLSELMEKGINVSLSEKSRLSFAPDIENLQISKDKYGVLHMHGVSKDGKQSIDFSSKNGNIQFEMEDGEVSRSYNNKMAGEWTWRNLKSPSGTYYFDPDGEKYAKEMAAVMDKIKAQHQTKTQQNTHVSSIEIVKDGGR